MRTVLVLGGCFRDDCVLNFAVRYHRNYLINFMCLVCEFIENNIRNFFVIFLM